jgi:hypothetical protein
MKLIFSFFRVFFLSSLITVLTYSQSPSVRTNQLPPSQQITHRSMWDIQLNLTVSGYGAIYDGTFFYVTDGATNLIRAYDTNGNLLYFFAVPGVSGLEDLAFDGLFEYGGTGTQTIYKMNFQTATLIGTISTPIPVRHIAYDTDNDAFWVGDWTGSIMLISRDGVVLNTYNTQLPMITGSAYDGVSPDGPYLWLFSGANPDTLPIYQFHIPTGTFTGVTHNVLSDIGIGQVDAMSGGLFFMDQFVPNTSSLGGILMGNPTKLFVYEIYNAIPVELLSFTGETTENGIKLNWSTATETNNYGFEIQRRKYGVDEGNSDWLIAGFVNGNGTTAEKNNYSFTDNNIEPADYQYRLNQIDFNGTSELSKIINITFQKSFTFKLEQNYPNPFNPTTTLKFTTGKFSFVTLKVYDILGNEVTTLVNEEKQPGNYRVEFNASGLTSGIYFYKIKAGNFVRTGKMLLLK